MRVRDDPRNPDPGFAELYDRLPPATDLAPWLGWCLAARQPVLYLGIGAGRLAEPLVGAGVHMVGVDAHPGMLERLRRRLPEVPVELGLVEDLDLGRTFDLVIAPSNLLGGAERLRGAARHVAAGGRLAFDLLNPHWLAAGGGPGVRQPRGFGGPLELDYTLADGSVWVQEVRELDLVWPESIESHLGAAGLHLAWMGGEPGRDVDESPTFYVLAARGGP